MADATNNGTLPRPTRPTARRYRVYAIISGCGWELAIPRLMWDGWTPGEQQAAINRQQAMMAKDGK